MHSAHTGSIRIFMGADHRVAICFRILASLYTQLVAEVCAWRPDLRNCLLLLSTVSKCIACCVANLPSAKTAHMFRCECCRMQVLSCIPTLRELDFVAVSKLDRDTVAVHIKAQHGRRKS